MKKAIAAAVLTSTLALAPAIDSVHAQDEPAVEEEEDSDNTGLWGLAGLLGLFGLLALRRRPDRVSTYATETTARRTP
jgi:MYXO-CTERM domain-containing protein